MELFFAFIGLIAGIISALFGIGGGIIVVPILLYFGIPSVSAVLCSIHMMLALTASSLINFKKLNLIDVKFGFLLAAASCVGTILGAHLVVWMGGGHHLITDYLLLTIVVVMLALQLQLFKVIPARFRLLLTVRLPLQTKFVAAESNISYLTPLLLGLVAGCLLSIVGVGGSFIIIPIIIYCLNFRHDMVSGTSHMMIFSSTIMALTSYSMIDIYPKLEVSVPLATGAVFGSIIGVALVKMISKQYFKMGFVALTVLLLVQIINDIIDPKVSVSESGAYINVYLLIVATIIVATIVNIAFAKIRRNLR